jgi:secondary thiamine-phosphate synthase enzyme
MRLRTSAKREVLDITPQVQEQLGDLEAGVVSVTVVHTTAAITTADLDPGTDLDLLEALAGLIPDQEWRHPHNPTHAPDHLLASVVGPSVTVPVREGKLMLGVWQRIILIEFDGPRERDVMVTALPATPK